VTAAVLTTDDKGFVRLSVMKDEITANKYEMPLKPLKKDQVITKKRATIGRGSAERMKWSEETARALAVSKFLKTDGFQSASTPNASSGVILSLQASACGHWPHFAEALVLNATSVELAIAIPRREALLSLPWTNAPFSRDFLFILQGASILVLL